MREGGTGLAPGEPIERQLAQSIAEDNWRLNRARAIENNIFALGYSNQGPNHPEIEIALSFAKTFMKDSRSIQMLAIYEQRLQRTVHKNRALLRELQAERKHAAA